MEDLIVNLAKGNRVTDDMIADELYEICDREHASCNSNCPVFKLNGGKVPNHSDPDECDTFKDGKAMLRFIRSHHGKPKPMVAIDWNKVKELAVGYVETLATGAGFKDGKHYIFEAAIEAVYGPEVWTWINNQPERED